VASPGDRVGVGVVITVTGAGLFTGLALANGFSLHSAVGRPGSREYLAAASLVS